MADDPEQNRLSRRLGRYVRVGTGVGGMAARVAGARLLGRDLSDPRNAADIAATLGSLKGPLMKVAQMMASIPDILPPDYAAELQKLQAAAPPMGWAFVRRRMQAELGPDWERRFAGFEHKPAAAASLGQVHRATAHDGAPLAVKLQYPNMESAVEADLAQLGVLLSLQRRFAGEIDTREIAVEIGERLREELDYAREAKHAALYRTVLAGQPDIRVPGTRPDLSTRRLLTMDWMDGRPLLACLERPLEERNRLATALFHAWWQPFARYGIIHGDPHLGNYTVFGDGEAAAGINLLDYGCVRIFRPEFVAGVVALYHGLKDDDQEAVKSAYRGWGFHDISDETAETLTIWARFIYAPLLDDRVRTIADGVAPHAYGRREVWEVKQRLKPQQTLRIPREFVFMERAAVGLGAVFLHLRAELNFHQLFEAEIAGFDVERLAERQKTALAAAGLKAP